MKGRVFSLLFFSLFLIILISGCQLNIPEKITGPAWTTKVSVPLVMRTKNTDGTTNSEIRLDGSANGLGETIGLNFVGTNLSNFNIPPAELDGGEFGYIVIESGVSFGNISLPPLQGTIPADYPPAAVDLGDYSGFTLSSNGFPYNTITVLISGGTAWTNGLTISFSNGVDTRTATIPNGETTVDLSLTNFEITDTLSIQISGDYNNSSGTGYVQFSLSELQVSQFNVDGSQLNAVSGDLTFDTSQEIIFPIGRDGTIIQLSALEFTLEGPELPENFIGTIDLSLDGQDSSGVSVLDGGAKNYNGVTIQRGTPYHLVLTGDINEILQNNPANLVFKVSAISFSGVPGQNIIIRNTDKILIRFTPKIGFNSITTAVQSMPFKPMEQNIIKSATLNFDITNNTPLGLTLKAYLAPGPDVKTNPKRIELTLEVPSSNSGVPKTVRSSLSITAQQFADLTESETIYNQFEIVAAATDESVQADPAPYLEIRSFAQAELLVNKQQ